MNNQNLNVRYQNKLRELKLFDETSKETGLSFNFRRNKLIKEILYLEDFLKVKKGKTEPLEKPIVFFDVETTGLDFFEDRIIEMSLIKIYDSNFKIFDLVSKIDFKKNEIKHYWFNPEKIMSDDVIKIHHITNDWLQNKPLFKDKAKEIYEFIKNCDIGGYNVMFDLYMLREELEKCGIEFDIESLNIVDVYKLWMHYEDRKLETAYKRFLGKELKGKHSAKTDVIATIQVLEVMKKQFGDEGLGNEALFHMVKDKIFQKNTKLIKCDGADNYIFGFGQYSDTGNKPKTLLQVYNEDLQYLIWLIQESNIDNYVKHEIRRFIRRQKKLEISKL